MFLTHLVVFSFLDGASAAATSSLTGRLVRRRGRTGYRRWLHEVEQAEKREKRLPAPAAFEPYIEAAQIDLEVALAKDSKARAARLQETLNRLIALQIRAEEDDEDEILLLFAA